MHRFRTIFEDLVVLTFALLGFVGGVGLLIVKGTSIPPVIYCVLLGVGISALVYRFLGGIPPGTSVAVGALKVSGSLAAIFASVLFLNGYLERQLGDRAIEEKDLVGRWSWQWAGENLYATLDFKQAQEGLTFEGTMLRARDGARDVLYQMREGRAAVSDDGRHLTLSFMVDEPGGRKYRLETVQPLRWQRSFGGLLRPDPADPGSNGIQHHTWGFSMVQER